jgi:hypothetical protein
MPPQIANLFPSDACRTRKKTEFQNVCLQVVWRLITSFPIDNIR